MQQAGSSTCELRQPPCTNPLASMHDAIGCMHGIVRRRVLVHMEHPQVQQQHVGHASVSVSRLRLIGQLKRTPRLPTCIKADCTTPAPVAVLFHGQYPSFVLKLEIVQSQPSMSLAALRSLACTAQVSLAGRLPDAATRLSQLLLSSGDSFAAVHGGSASCHQTQPHTQAPHEAARRLYSSAADGQRSPSSSSGSPPGIACWRALYGAWITGDG